MKYHDVRYTYSQKILSVVADFFYFVIGSARKLDFSLISDILVIETKTETARKVYAYK